MAAISTALPYTKSATGSLVLPSDPTDPSQVSATASQAAGNLAASATALTNTGSSALGPVLTRLTKLLSGDPTQVAAATEPQTRSIMQAYDAARKSSAEFAGRGGGVTSANITSQASEASDIATTKNTAINDASQQLGQLAAQVLGIGASEATSAVSGFLGLVNSAVTQRGQTASFWGDLGKGVGSLLGGLLAAG